MTFPSIKTNSVVIETPNDSGLNKVQIIFLIMRYSMLSL